MTKRKWLVVVIFALLIIAGATMVIIAYTQDDDTYTMLESSDNFIVSIPADTDDWEIWDSDRTPYYSDAYIYTTESEPLVYQDISILAKAWEYIEQIPLPHYYSEYNGEPLTTDNVSIRVEIDIYDFQTGDAKLSARATIPDVNPMAIILMYKEPDVITEDSYGMFLPSDQFTLEQLRMHLDYFYWEKDMGWY